MIVIVRMVQPATRTAGQNGDQPGELSMSQQVGSILQPLALSLRKRTHARL